MAGITFCSIGIVRLDSVIERLRTNKRAIIQHLIPYATPSRRFLYHVRITLPLGAVAKRLPLNMQMGLGHEKFDEFLRGWASDRRLSESNQRRFYNHWELIMGIYTLSSQA